MGARPAVSAVDRRYRRRQESIEEILGIAVELMTEQGVGGLSLGEVARRMGIRTPSLYVYFPSKDALYDAVFARAAREAADVFIDSSTRQLASLDQSRPLEELLFEEAEIFVRWTLEHPAYAELLYWRPVPGFEPSPEAFSPAVEMWQAITEHFAALQRAGLIRADAEVDHVQQDWATIMTGVVTRQLANAPHERFDEGRVTSRLGDLLAIFSRYYSAPTRRGSRRAGER